MTCANCGADLAAGAMFCGECGAAAYSAGAAPAAPAPREYVDAAGSPESPNPLFDEMPDHEGPGGELGRSDGGSVRWQEDGPDAQADGPDATRDVDLDDPAAAGPRLLAVPGRRSAGVDEATRLPERARPAASAFALHFSTGESVTVEGTGLIGRRPSPQPGEYFDSYVAIDDPGRSVSKTHLEFGQDGGAFWISDRFSANGTVIREPGREPRLCPAGLRSRIVRGTRVDIGEQFFLVT